jgi:hypothetical protein
MDPLIDPLTGQPCRVSNGWTWDARDGLWTAEVDGQTRYNPAACNDPPQTPPRHTPVGTRRGLPVYADLCALAESGCEDGYDAAGGRFYLIQVPPSEELANPVPGDPSPYYAPWRGGSCYAVDRLLNDPRTRRAVKITAASRRRNK